MHFDCPSIQSPSSIHARSLIFAVVRIENDNNVNLNLKRVWKQRELLWFYWKFILPWKPSITVSVASIYLFVFSEITIGCFDSYRGGTRTRWWCWWLWIIGWPSWLRSWTGRFMSGLEGHWLHLWMMVKLRGVQWNKNELKFCWEGSSEATNCWHPFNIGWKRKRNST